MLLQYLFNFGIVFIVSVDFIFD